MTRKGLSWRDFNWATGGFIIGYHLALLVGLPFYFYHSPPRPVLVAVSVLLLLLTEIGIGAAYHRYYAHRSYALSKPAEAVLLFLATLAMQGSALQWSHDHRLHHAFVDTDDDPYSIKKGFWYAHILWLFEKNTPLDTRRVPDLLANKLVTLQHKQAHLLSIVSNGLVCLLVGWLVSDFLGAFVLAWWTRLLVSHHLTWFVNSLAHFWGQQTYSKEHSAVDNYVLALLTVGEGYHNYHHTFPTDYRNGVRWYHFDPTKWTIWTLSKLGLASSLRRFSDYKIKKRLLLEDRKLLLQRLGREARNTRLELERRITQLSERMTDKLNRLSSLTDQIRQLKQQGRAAAQIRAARQELRALRQSMRRDWGRWNELCAAVL